MSRLTPRPGKAPSKSKSDAPSRKVPSPARSVPQSTGGKK